MSWVPEPAIGAAPPRVAFALARPVGPAVVRNRLRRQLWHHLVERQRVDGALPAGDYLVTVAPGGADEPGSQLRADLDRALGDAVAR